MSNPTPHPLAAQIAEWAQDMAKDKNIVWEAKPKDYLKSPWMTTQPDWDDNFIYRRKPAEKIYIERTIRYPKPLTEAPSEGTEVWAVGPTEALEFKWRDIWWTQIYLNAGLVFATREDAEECRIALYGGGV